MARSGAGERRQRGEQCGTYAQGCQVEQGLGIDSLCSCKQLLAEGGECGERKRKRGATGWEARLMRGGQRAVGGVLKIRCARLSLLCLLPCQWVISARVEGGLLCPGALSRRVSTCSPACLPACRLSSRARWLSRAFCAGSTRHMSMPQRTMKPQAGVTAHRPNGSRGARWSGEPSTDGRVHATTIGQRADGGR